MSWLPYHHDWRLVYQSSVGLRLHWFDRYASQPDWYVAPARLAADMVTFFFVERNTCWAVVNGRRWNLRRGTLLVVMGGDEFSLRHNPLRPHVSLSASLSFEQGGRVNALLYRKFQRRYVWRNPEEYVTEFEKIRAGLASTSTFRDLTITGAMLQWLAYLMDKLRPPMSEALVEERSVVDKVLQAECWANTRLRDVITLSAWSRAVGLNPVYFGRVFKRETGLTPFQWLNQRRLQTACQYLAGTSKSVTEIAEACGFASSFYFSRVFRRHFGQPPLHYRRTQR